MIATAKNELVPSDILKTLTYAMVYSMSVLIIASLFMVPAVSIGWLRADLLKPVYLYGIYFVILIGGGLAGHRLRGHGWFIGIVFAVVFLILASLIAPVWSRTGLPASVFILRSLIALGVGAIGGMIGVNL